MGSIPFTASNMHVVDEETGVDYEMAQSTDDIELAIIELSSTFESDIKKRVDIFLSNESEYRRWINGHIDIILKGWSGVPGLPEFPKSFPSAQMQGALKTKLLEAWKVRNSFTRDDLKK